MVFKLSSSKYYTSGIAHWEHQLFPFISMKIQSLKSLGRFAPSYYFQFEWSIVKVSAHKLSCLLMLPTFYPGSTAKCSSKCVSGTRELDFENFWANESVASVFGSFMHLIRLNRRYECSIFLLCQSSEELVFWGQILIPNIPM